MVLGLLSSLLFIIVPIALVVWAVRRAGARSGSGTDSRSIRRFFQYLLLYALLIVAAAGLSGLLGLLSAEPSLAGDDSTALARALTFTVFGLPIFALLAAWSRRRLAQDADEARSLGWTLYATAAPLTALIVAMTALQTVVSSALTGERFAWAALSRFVVWTTIWLAHWVLARRTLASDRQQGHLVLGALIGLGTSIGGLVWLLGVSLDALLLERTADVLVQQDRPLAGAAATVVVGVPVWIRYWLRGYANSQRNPLWFGYVLPVGVGGSLVLTVVGASTALYEVLVWVIGDPSANQAAQHFAGTPTAVAAVVVGAASWWYHRQVLLAAAPERTETTRVYEYLMAGIALLAAAVGVALVIVALIESLVGPAAVELGTSVVNSLLAAVTLLLVGGPLWWAFWSRIGRATRTDDDAELASPTRRIYLFVLFGLGGVVAVVAVLVAAYLAIQGALEGGFGSAEVRAIRVPVAILLATGAISGYHWTVYRADRAALPAPSPARQLGPRYILLVGAADDGVGAAVARRTGARVEVWARTDGLAGPWVVDDVVAAVSEAIAVSGAAADSVMVFAGPDGLETTGVRRP